MYKTLSNFREILRKVPIGLMLVVLCASQALAQERNVSGKVTSVEDNLGLPGVNIIVKGTSSGTVTDSDGNFTLSVQGSDAVLVFSAIGFTTQEVAVGSQSTLNVTMQVDITTLSEVIVVGYGTQEKREVTAAISSLGGEAITKIATTNALEGMKGQMSGVDIQQFNGKPGSAPSILIRGHRSLTASNDPLFVVDGVPIGTGTSTTDGLSFTTSGSNPLNDFNPADIASIEVLKDAAATAIYGSRGSNGVVLITTKRGKSGKTSVTYSGYYGVTQPFKLIDMMNGEQFAAFKREANRLDKVGGAVGRKAWGDTGSVFSPDGGPTGTFRDPTELANATDANGVKGVDWQDLIFKNGKQTDHNISVNGGNDKTQYNISIGYFKQDGNIEGMDFTKYSTRVNLDHQMSKRIKLGMSNSFNRSITNDNTGSAYSEAISQSPLGEPYNADGTPRFQPIGDGIRSNPLSELVKGKRLDQTVNDRVFSSAYAEVSIVEGLKYKLLGGMDLRYTTRGTFEGQFTNNVKNGSPRATYQNQVNANYTVENLLTYNKTFGDHTLGVTGLYSIQANNYENHYASVQNLPYETQKWYNLGTAGTISALRSRLEQWSLMSFMGRLNYQYKGKYLFQASLRADGSSRLAPSARWTSFPGVSVGWRIKEEGFLSGVSFLTDLKLRGSFGVVGNTAINPYVPNGTLARTQYSFDNSINASGFALDKIPNPSLGWEKTKTVDVGFDFGFFNGRLSGSFDYYVADISALLLNRNLPQSTGYTGAFQNVGSTQNKGFDFNIHANVLSMANGFTWDIDFNASHYTEKIKDVAQYDPTTGAPIDDTGNKWFIGQPLTVYFDYQKIGIWQKDEVAAAASYGFYPGEIKVRDVDGDGVISPKDRVILGNNIPSAYGGLNSRFGFKGIDLSVFFYYRLNYMIDSQFSADNASMQGRYNNVNVDYWTVDNPTNAYPRPNFAQESATYGSTLRYYDGGFVKLRTLSLGYTLPKSITSAMKITNFRIYFTGQNLFAWSKYKLMDPESANSISASDIPSTKVFMGGVNITF